MKGGLYSRDYLARAVTTYTTFGANVPQDSVYPHSQVDGSGEPYSGANKYGMHFAKGQTPPVKGFWSLTMYNADYFFVPNTLDKYNVSHPRDKFKLNEDGSFDLYIQNESPGEDKKINWLPAPKDRFNLVMRLYYPSDKAPSILDGTWAPPAVEKVK